LTDSALPKNVLNEAEQALNNLILLEKSKDQKKILVYFHEMVSVRSISYLFFIPSKKRSPSSLWTYYSMLRSTNIKDVWKACFGYTGCLKIREFHVQSVVSVVQIWKLKKNRNSPHKDTLVWRCTLWSAFSLNTGSEKFSVIVIYGVDDCGK
jgi:hypothetical protein